MHAVQLTIGSEGQQWDRLMPAQNVGLPKLLVTSKCAVLSDLIALQSECVGMKIDIEYEGNDVLSHHTLQCSIY